VAALLGTRFKIMMRRPIIRTEAELYDWLLGYMRRTGRVRQYPKPLVELTDHLLDRILMDDIWEGELLKEFYGDTDLCGCCGGHFSGALHNLLEQMADNTDQLPCCSPLVVLAAEILRLFPAPIELRACLRRGFPRLLGRDSWDAGLALRTGRHGEEESGSARLCDRPDGRAVGVDCTPDPGG
jgi:hypothetical protein